MEHECFNCGCKFESKWSTVKFCKECRPIIDRLQRQISKRKNINKILSYEKIRYQKNKESIKERVRNYKRERREEVNIKAKDYYKNNLEKVKVYQKGYRSSHKEKIQIRDKIYREKNHDKSIENGHKYYKENKEVLLKKQKEYSSRPEVSVKSKIVSKNYREKNKDIISLKAKEYRKKNTEKIRKLQKEYGKKNRKILSEKSLLRYRNDIEHHIKEILRSSLRKALKIYTIEGKMMIGKLYGVNYGAILEYLKPFPEDLSKYHIDHILPLCSFKFVREDGSTNLEEIKKAFAPDNHRWLLARENLSKATQDKKISINNKNRNCN